jgi:DNA-repair protein XRCC1
LKKNVSSLSNSDKSVEQSVEAKNEENSVAGSEDNDAVKIGSLFAKWQTDKQKGIKYDDDDNDDGSRSRMSRTSSASAKSSTKAKDSIGNLKRKAEKSEQAEKPSELNNNDDEDKNKNSSGGRKELKTSRNATKLEENEDRLNEASSSKLKKETAAPDNDADPAKSSITKALDKKLKSESEETKVNKNGEKANAKSVSTEANKAKSASVLFKSIVFVLSGFQNPERSDLRNKAIELGAKYKPDWDKECTHLM